MSIKVKCPECMKVLTVPDAARGKAIKCPSCDSRIPVPKGETEAAVKTGAKGKKPVKKAGPVDDESGLASLDLRKLADSEAHLCPKCGYDMDLIERDEDEEITECPKCGWDVAEGGLGAKARKRAMKGPDPDKYYQGLWKNSWKFVKTNYFLAFRTFAYTMIASLIMFGSIFMYLWISMWPPRYFFAFVTFVSAMVIPGWIWYLDTEIIKLTLERRDKFKRLHFDFFLAAALGVKFVLWNVVVAGPLLLIPGLIGFSLWHFVGLPMWVMFAILGVCYVPIFGLWPVSLTHMTMPNEYPGWMFWKVIPQAFSCFKPLFTWFMLFVVTNLPVLLIAAPTLLFTAAPLAEYVEIMEHNAEFNRTKDLWDYYSGSKNKPKDLVDPASLGEPLPVEFRHELAITIGMMAWLIGGLIFAFTSLFSMRTNGYFAYYFRDRLDLQALIKELKYVATISRDKEKKILTTQEMFAQAGLTMVICVIVVAMFRVLFAATGVFSEDIVPALLYGVDWGLRLAIFIGFSVITKAAWEESPMWGLIVQGVDIAIGATIVAMIVSFFIGRMLPLPFLVLLFVIWGLGVLSIIGNFAFVIHFWEDSGAGCLTVILSMMAQIVMVPIVLLALGLNLMSLPGIISDKNDQQNQQAPVNPGGGMQPGGAMPGGPGGMPGVPGGGMQPGGGPMPGGLPPAAGAAGVSPVQP